jgi:hypothetical protein
MCFMGSMRERMSWRHELSRRLSGLSDGVVIPALLKASLRI